MNKSSQNLLRNENPLVLEPEGEVGPVKNPTSEEKLFILGAILQGLICEVMSGDVVTLATYRARQICFEAGVDDELFCDVANEFIEVARKARKRNPMSGMF